jgi:hypothetical protein
MNTKKAGFVLGSIRTLLGDWSFIAHIKITGKLVMMEYRATLAGFFLRSDFKFLSFLLLA